MHWLAWAMALLALGVLVFAMVAPDSVTLRGFILLDLGLSAFFALEFSTRTGYRAQRARYIRWRWFDLVAIAPAGLLVSNPSPWAVAAVWIVLVCRVIRSIDRTLGDGFVQRQMQVIVGALEEEVTDRVVEKILARWQAEIARADFGGAAAAALARNKDAVLQRVYREQLTTGAFAKLARFSGLRGSLEREEARLFQDLIDVVGSPDVDQAIREVVTASFQSLRTQLGRRTWLEKLGRPGPRIA